ncbi:hypothetical protein [Pleurocapsa sp. FMAR1]|nr:hypothetical protein [Pleurocapsa sp. FMAR1]
MAKINTLSSGNGLTNLKTDTSLFAMNSNVVLINCIRNLEFS